MYAFMYELEPFSYKEDKNEVKRAFTSLKLSQKMGRPKYLYPIINTFIKFLHVRLYVDKRNVQKT